MRYVIPKKEYQKKIKGTDIIGVTKDYIKESEIKKAGITYLRKYDDDEKKEKEKYFEITKDDEIIKKKLSKIPFIVRGYILVEDEGEIKYVTVCFPLALLLIPVVIGLGLLLFLPQSPVPRVFGAIEMDESQHDKRDDDDLPDAATEYTQFNGYSKITVSEEKNIVALSNPEVNTSNFVYTITQDVNRWEETSFEYGSDDERNAAIENGQKYISENQKTYANGIDGNKLVFVCDNEKTNSKFTYNLEDTGKSINVIKTEKRLIYYTKGIAPGKSVDWKITDYMNESSDVNFEISTFDVETNRPGTGTNMAVQIIFN